MALEYYLMSELPTKQTTIKGHLEGAAPAEAAPDGTKYFDADTGDEWVRFQGVWQKAVGGLRIRDIDLSGVTVPAHPVQDDYNNTLATITGDTYSIAYDGGDTYSAFVFGPEEATSGRIIWSPHDYSAGGMNGLVVYDNGSEMYTYSYMPGDGLVAAPPGGGDYFVLDAAFEPGDFLFMGLDGGNVVWGTTNVAASPFPGSGHAFTMKPTMAVSAIGGSVTATITTMLDGIVLPPDVEELLADYPAFDETAAATLPMDAASGDFFRVVEGGTFNGVKYLSPTLEGNAEGFLVAGTSPLSIIPVKQSSDALPPLEIDLAAFSGTLPNVVAGTRFRVTGEGTLGSVDYREGDMFTVLDAGTNTVNPERGRSVYSPENPPDYSGLVQKTNGSYQLYGTNEDGVATTMAWPTIKDKLVMYPEVGEYAGRVQINTANHSLKSIAVILNNDLTTWSFVPAPSGSIAEIEIEIVQGGTPKACVSPTTSSRTAGGAWTVSSTPNSRQRLRLLVDELGNIDMFPYPVLS